MAVMQTNELLADHQLFSQALWARPLFAQVRPLYVRLHSPATREAEFEVLLADLLHHPHLVQGQRLRFFAPPDSSVLLTQPYAAPRRLDSTSFAPCDLLTPAHYHQL
ncbi:hypothetical protein GO988_21360 [Hymenobacter sp. HMF4947]|uniref:Uncharacterized protein n=1 Tax=Hymenobacter ginkgonis TaxID=2682976 RepID=A0A7K1TKE6_9BACT|nr:hypothetical protein [Hymenobacter ginkgonis]MVN78887.1 hypothetical protein [Hymenobacter ginkgonis]